MTSGSRPTEDEVRKAIESDYLNEETDAVMALIDQALAAEHEDTHALCVTAQHHEDALANRPALVPAAPECPYCDLPKDHEGECAAW